MPELERDLQRVMVACRGAPAARIVRTVHDMGLEAVVAIADADGEAAWPDVADYQVHVPATESGAWPDPGKLAERAIDAGCDALHPGWSWIAKHPPLSRELEKLNVLYIGATADQLALAADRPRAREVAVSQEIPVVPGSAPLQDPADVETWIARTGLPAMCKPIDRLARGHIVALDDPATAVNRVKRALQAGPVYLERTVECAREIEVPVLGDGEGGVLAFGEREVTVQTGRRRLLAEAPCADIKADVRERMRVKSELLASHLKWSGLVSVVFLLTPDGRAYFLQLRPGLQAWDAVTEVLYGVDLVEAHFRLASGETLGWQQDDLAVQGHAVSMRLFAGGGEGTESATAGAVTLPEGLRFDGTPIEGDAVEPGQELGALIALGQTRQAAIVKARAALDEVEVDGVALDLAFLKRVLDDPRFWRGAVDRDRLKEMERG